MTLRPDRTSVLRVGREAEVRIPEGTIYEPIFVRPGLGEAPQADSGVVVLSPAYRFFDPATPLFRAVEVTASAAACRARCNYAPNWPYARAEARWPASEAHMPTAR